MTQDSNARTWGAVTTSAGAAALATAASACCVPVFAPLFVSVLGVSGAVWAAGLAPYAFPILLLSGLLLGYGFWTVYRPRPGSDDATCPVRRPLPVRAVLWCSAAFWALALGLNVLQFLRSMV